MQGQAFFGIVQSRLDSRIPPIYICIMTQISKRKPLTPKLAAECCGPIDDLLDAELFKGLCDPTRLKLLGCLSKCGRACSVSELAECCSVDFSVVSRHLALLERAGIVESTKQGRTVFYEVKYVELSAKLRALADAMESCCPCSGPGKGKASCCGGK
jgi:DNA-binding transcriptional ArsR family regulator